MAINPRWLRKGRVAYLNDTNFEYLLESIGPGQWRTVHSTGSVRQPSAKSLSGAYGRLMTSTSMLPRTGEVRDGLTNVIDGLKSLGHTSSAVANVIARLEREVAIRSGGSVASAVKEAKETEDTSAHRASGKFEVDPYDPDSFFFESDDDAALYRDFVTMRQNHHPVNLLIAGPSGSGKTEGVIKMGKRLGIPVHIVNCQAITTPEKWIGQMQADPEHGTYFVPSQHIQWVERTHEDCEGAEYCILLYDEITRLRPDLNNMTYSLFDTQKGLEVPQMGRRVIMAPQNMVVATANLGAPYTGTHTQDRAFRERFSITMERGFATPANEKKVLKSAFPRLSDSDAATLVAIAKTSRELWERDEIDSPISTRVLKSWALLVAGGYGIKKAAEYTVIPLYSNDGGSESDRTRIATLIEGKVRA